MLKHQGAMGDASPEIERHIKRSWMRKLVAMCVALACAGVAAPALAQIDIPVVNNSYSPQGINLATGQPSDALPGVSIGNSNDGGLSVEFYFDGWTYIDTGFGTAQLPNFNHSLRGWIATNTDGTMTVHVGRMTDNFTSSYVPIQAMGTSLVHETDGTFTYRYRDGTEAKFSTGALITEIKRPNGENWVFTYSTFGSLSMAAITSVKNNFGYEIDLDYDSTSYFYPFVTKATAWNYSAGSGGYSARTEATVAWDASTATMSSSGPYGSNSFVVNGCGESSSAIGVSISYTYDSSCRVLTVTNPAGTWSYGYVDSGDNRTVTITDPLSHSRVTTLNKVKGMTQSQADGLGNTTRYFYDTNDRLEYVVSPLGTVTSGAPTAGYVRYFYDARGNVYQTTRKAISGSLADITTSAAFDSSCSNPKTCNQPNSTTDANGQTAYYAYDYGTGLPTQTQSPYIGGTYGRAEVDITYQAVTAVSGMPAVYRPQYSVTCATAATCSGTANEVKTAFTYGSTGDPNAPYARTVSVGAGNATSGQISTTTLTYSIAGDLATSDGPLSGSDDTTHYYYSSAHWLSATVGPDPDGSGSRANPVIRSTYDSVGRPTLSEVGTVPTATTDPWGSSFTLRGYQQATYDSDGRKTLDTAVGDGGTILSIIQYSYDAASRLDCTAQRMIPSSYSSLPTSACDQASRSSSDPYDRIVQNHYDAADRVTSVVSGLGGSAATHTEVTLTYTADSLRETLADADTLSGSHLTTYEYDGFDRLYKVRYPNPTSSGSSSSDYEQYAYDAASNITSIRARSGTSYSASYDSLNRQTTTPDGQTIVYDNLSRQASIAKSSIATTTITWGAVGQKLTEGGAFGTVNYEYDLAGRRTKMTWPDSFAVSYDWYLDGVKAIREYGVTSGPGVLATYVYDDLGRRTSITRGNGTSTSYTYDTDSTLKTLSQSITSASNTTTFTRNRAGQILSKAITNDAYIGPARGGGGDAVTPVNNLNQITKMGANNFTYDNRGNLQSALQNGYGYDGANRLTSVTGAATLSYDAVGRLAIITGSTTTKFAYDGADVIADYDASNAMKNRYVPGPGDDEYVAWYQVSGGSSTRRLLAADELGSIVGVTNDSGGATAINAYDEYGQPKASNIGRFQYTGQMWLGEVGLYHYKARAYSPLLGRFLQTDPIGYADGPNWYEYTHGDPVNTYDPTGLRTPCMWDPLDVSGSIDGVAVCPPDREPGCSSNIRRCASSDPNIDPNITFVSNFLSGIRGIAGTGSFVGPANPCATIAPGGGANLYSGPIGKFDLSYDFSKGISLGLNSGKLDDPQGMPALRGGYQPGDMGARHPPPSGRGGVGALISGSTGESVVFFNPIRERGDGQLPTIDVSMSRFGTRAAMVPVSVTPFHSYYVSVRDVPLNPAGNAVKVCARQK